MALIKTKVIAKTKAGNSVTLTSSGAVYGGATSGNAKYAETAGYAEKAGYANEAAHAASAADLDPAKQAELDDKYLYRKEEDTALERITFEKGITANGNIEANVDVNIKGETNADGLVHANAGATFGDLFSFDENGNIVAHTITSSDFDTLAVSDEHKDKKGYTIAVKDSTDGTYKLLIDELRAWSKTITEELVVSGNASNGDFVSGFLGGRGWGITPRTVINSAGVEEQKWTAEFDNIVVRGGLKVYEMVVSQLVGENDNRVFTGMLEVDHYDKESGKVYLNTNDGQTYNPFRTGDYIMVQQFTYDTSESNDVTKGYELIVEEYGNEGEGENMLAWVTFSNFTSSFIENPTPETLIAEGDTFVRVDNISDPDRKGIVQIVSVGTATPYMDVIQGMKTDPTDSLKARLGNLAGIIHPNFGSLEGFGLYSSNAYLTGDFTLRRTGEDLDTKFQILEDKFSSRFAKAEDGLTDDANFLHNGRFNLNNDGEIDGWTEQGDDGEWFLGPDGLPLMINGQTTKDGLDRIVLENVGGKKVLHMYSANGNTVTMSQANELIKQPTTHTEYIEPEYTTTKDGNGNICDVTTTKEADSVEVPDTLYLSAKLLPKAGTTVTLTLGETQGSTIAISKTYDADAKEWETVEQAGTWDGKGGFVLTVDGDCYVTDVMLTTDSTENLKASYETSITQTAKEIELQAAKTTNLGTQIGYVKVEADKVSAKVTSLEKGLEDTGIDITDKKILATADNFVVRNNNGATTMTIDQNGNLCTSGDAAIKGTVYATNGEFTGKVTATSGTFNGTVYASNGEFSGTIHASQGTIGNWIIGENRIGAGYTDGGHDGAIVADSNGLFLYNNMIGFNETNRQALLGTLNNWGAFLLCRLYDTHVDTSSYGGVTSTYTLGKVGLSINIRNSDVCNDAIQISGGCISGLNLRTEYISSSGQTIKELSNAVFLSSRTEGFTVYMPNFGTEKACDGHVIMIKRHGSYTPKIVCQGNNAFIFQEGQVSQTNESMAWNGCSATFIFFPSLTIGSYSGVWVEWRGVHAEN